MSIVRRANICHALSIENLRITSRLCTENLHGFQIILGDHEKSKPNRTHTEAVHEHVYKLTDLEQLF